MADNINIAVAPSLSEDGWVFSSLKQADIVIGWYLASDYSQSNFFKGKVSSFTQVISVYGNQPKQLMIAVEADLKTLFERYFNNVVVQCTDQTAAAWPDNPNTGKFALGIYLQFTMADGTTDNLSRVGELKDSRFTLINNAILNGG